MAAPRARPRARATAPAAPVLFTIGHSTRPVDELIALLAENGIALLVDIRRFPGSRRHPQYGSAALERALAAAGIAYRWMEPLGGRRTRRKDTPHTGWQVAAFAGYADHMETPAFVAAATELLAEAAARRTAILCAEARPEQCHRRLVADWVTAHGARVAHIERPGRVRPHVLPPFARVDGGRVVYDGGGSLSGPSSG
jgi:uncharacterized protein (DUF488 family)